MVNNNSSLPVEILEEIVENIISEYPNGLGDHKFLPHWQWVLAPLLHVSKLWHGVAERHMYKCISVGRPFSRATQREGLELGPEREGFEVAKKLLETLTTNPRLAAFVEELQLAIKDVDDAKALEWARTNVGILRVCTNVQHVEMRGFVSEEFELGTLADVLKEKSLVSFRINQHGLVRRTAPFCTFNLFGVLQKWPRLRSINIEGFAFFRGCNEIGGVDFSGATYCLPELREVVITRLDTGALLVIEFNTLRVMCGSVTNLSISGWIDEESIRKALCECLRAWSPTLDCVSLQIFTNQPMYRSLFETLFSLTGLRELQIYAPRLYSMTLDFSRIADLPRLERFCFATQAGMSAAEVHALCDNLTDPEKFLALRHIATTHIRSRDNVERLESACLQRGVRWVVTLWSWEDRKSISGFAL